MKIKDNTCKKSNLVHRGFILVKRLMVLLLILVLWVVVSGVAQGQSGKAATVEYLEDSVFQIENPCENDAITTVTLSNRKLTSRLVEDSPRPTHEIQMITADLRDDFGYSGHFSLSSNDNIGEGETHSFNLNVNSNKPGTGKTVRRHILTHVTIIDGEPIVTHGMGGVAVCIGKPTG